MPWCSRNRAGLIPKSEKEHLEIKRPRLSYETDQRGRLSYETDQRGRLSYEMDKRGRLSYEMDKRGRLSYETQRNWTSALLSPLLAIN
jgi:hypothetical protein